MTRTHAAMLIFVLVLLGPALALLGLPIIGSVCWGAALTLTVFYGSFRREGD